jgi:hypothetical protein
MFLDLLGNPDPTYMINLETGRIPFKYASLRLSPVMPPSDPQPQNE